MKGLSQPVLGYFSIDFPNYIKNTHDKIKAKEEKFNRKIPKNSNSIKFAADENMINKSFESDKPVIRNEEKKESQTLELITTKKPSQSNYKTPFMEDHDQISDGNSAFDEKRIKKKFTINDVLLKNKTINSKYIVIEPYYYALKSILIEDKDLIPDDKYLLFINPL